MILKQLFYNATHANWITEKDTDTQYAIEVKDEELIFKFQYTKSFIDWILNFLFFPLFMVKPYHHMPHVYFVHLGFLLKYKSIRKEIHKAVIENPNLPIKILGYSEGADIGLLAHEDINFTYGIRPESYLFGTSRVFSLFGYWFLKDRLKGVTLIENSNDIVCKIPFWIMGYKKYGKIIHIGSKRRFYIFSVKDHLPESYREALN